VIEDEFEWLRQLTFAPSRIPKLDALVAFVPFGQERDPNFASTPDGTGFSRWFPVDGGHRVVVPFEGGAYDSGRFSIEPEGWDHETCKICRTPIPSMTLCWVSEGERYVILCEQCHERFLSLCANA